jgi:hypothetical protein
MSELDGRTMTFLELALEEACRELPHGGDHAVRKKVAQKLLQRARDGDNTLSELITVARIALVQATSRKSA